MGTGMEAADMNAAPAAAERDAQQAAPHVAPQDAPLRGLRVALFSGNYNYVRDGANQALNRLVGYLQRQGAAVHVYAPKVKNPAFASMGKLIGLPSIPMPGRGEYRVPMLLGRKARIDLKTFKPHPLRYVSALLQHGLAGAGADRAAAPVLSALRCAGRAV